MFLVLEGWNLAFISIGCCLNHGGSSGTERVAEFSKDSFPKVGFRIERIQWLRLVFHVSSLEWFVESRVNCPMCQQVASFFYLLYV